MSNAPKTGFWSSIPGLITATAGFLSAATGAIVALNQTGVVDLKKIASNKPPEQTAPTPAQLAAPSEDKKPSPAPTEPAQPQSMVDATGLQSKPIEAPKPTTLPTPAETKPQPLAPPPSAPPATAETKPEPNPGPAEAVAKKETEQPKMQAPPSAEPSKPTPSTPSERAASGTSPPTQAPPVVHEQPKSEPKPAPGREAARPETHSPTRETEKVMPAPSGPDRAADARKPEVKSAPSSPPVDRAPVRAPDPKERLADARTADRPPARPSDDDTTKARIVRPPSVAEPGPKPKDSDRGERVRPAGPELRSAGSDRGRQIDLTGLKMTAPPGWVREEVASSPMAPEAAFRIPDPAGDGSVQITRYLGAKGKEMEEKNIDRWLSQVVKPNGQPSSRGDAKIERRQHGSIRVTTVELTGTLKMSPRETGHPDQAMVAAILDHTAGPHLVTITGPARSMARWSPLIDDFLRSVKPE